MQQKTSSGVYVHKREVAHFSYFGTQFEYCSNRNVTVYYPSIEAFFAAGYNEQRIKSQAGYHIGEFKCQHVVSSMHKKYRSGYVQYYNKKYCHKINCHEHEEREPVFVVYDENDNLITPDRLVGLYREWKYTWRKPGYIYRSQRSKRAYGHYRTIKTFQERKWACAWDDEEFAPKPRARRQDRNLPNSWDDYITHNEKSWKRQSKRKHQWR